MFVCIHLFTCQSSENACRCWMWYGNIFMYVHCISRLYKAHLLLVMSYRLPKACLHNLQNCNLSIMFTSTITLQNGASFLRHLTLTVDISMWQGFKKPYTCWYSCCTFVTLWKWANLMTDLVLYCRVGTIL